MHIKFWTFTLGLILVIQIISAAPRPAEDDELVFATDEEDVNNRYSSRPRPNKPRPSRPINNEDNYGDYNDFLKPNNNRPGSTRPKPSADYYEDEFGSNNNKPGPIRPGSTRPGSGRPGSNKPKPKPSVDYYEDEFSSDQINPVPGRPGTGKPGPGRPNRPTPRPSQTTTTPAPPGPKRPSACEANCLTTSQYNPVCGNDMVTYSNLERLNCAKRCGKKVVKLRDGSCQKFA